MKTVLALIALSVSLSASADSERKLDCISFETPTGEGEVRSVLIGDYSKPRTLLESSAKNARKVRLKRFAVVSQIIPDSGRRGATYEWEVLRPREYSLVDLAENDYSFTQRAD